jgi:ribosomal protein L4
MILNDLNDKINIKEKGKFYKEISVDDDGEGIAYVFPDTKEFINILKRKLIQEKFLSIVEEQDDQKIKAQGI